MTAHLFRASMQRKVCHLQALRAVRVSPPMTITQPIFLKFIQPEKRQLIELGQSIDHQSMRKFRKRQICGIAASVIFFALGLFAIFGLESIVDSMVVDNVKLAPENYELWGQNPGQSGVTTVRNFTFFNLTNPRGFIYRGELPRFHQMSNYVLQEKSNFTNVTYSEDMSTISYYYWLHFDILKGSRDLDQYVNIINLAPLSFWSQIQNVGLQTFAMQGFGGLFLATNQSIVVQVLAQGVAALYLAKQSSWVAFCQRLQIGDKLCTWLWEDEFFGLNDGNKYIPWVEWAYYGDKQAGVALIDYFSLEDMQVIQLQQLMKEWCQALNDIVDDWYCDGNTCKTIDLTHAQLGWSGLTANPPVGPAMDSVCDSGNITCKGYPQLGAYYKKVFMRTQRSKQFQNLTFSPATVSKLFTPYNGSLLNIGNLTNLFQTGLIYDQDKTNSTAVEKIKAMTHAQTKYHAIVIWEYVKYFTDEFVLKKSQGGRPKIAGMGGLFSQGLYLSISGFSGWFFEEFVSMLAAEQIGVCELFIKKTTESISVDTINQLCHQVTTENYTSYLKLIRPCQNMLLRDDFMQKYGLGSIAISELCDLQEESFLTVSQNVHSKIKQHYNCKANPHKERCTQFQIGAMQFFNSSITTNPLKSIKIYPESLSGKHWSSDLDEFEYRNYLQEVHGDAWVDRQEFNYSQMASLLSFDKLYSVGGVMDLILENNVTKFQEVYYWKNKSFIYDFIKFFMIQVGFGGITQRRTVRDFVLGYEDPFLKALQQMDPMMGGDPSLQTIVTLNDVNDTIDSYSDPQSMYTGYSDYTKTRNFISNFGNQYISFNQTQYNGYQITSQFVNPFIEPSYLHGTDGVQNKPLSTPEDDQSFFLDTLYRVAQMSFDRWDQRYGFDVLRYKIGKNVLASEEQYPPNKNFRQGYSGFLNLSFLGPPVYMSKNHMQGADQFWFDRMEIYDEKGENPQFPSEWDESVLVMEPKSGATFEATCFLQSNFNFKGDMLFNVKETMMPVVSVYRAANLTEDKAGDLLGPLKIALKAPRYMTIFCVVLLILSIVATVCCIMRRKKQEVSPSLLESTESALIDDKVDEKQSEQEQKEKGVEGLVSS